MPMTTYRPPPSAALHPRRLVDVTRQRGAAALAVAMVLLFLMTLIIFFVNRGLLFEQKTSANQYRSTRAFEVAEAGIEWATAMLNDPRRIEAGAGGSSCAPAASEPRSFRALYAPSTGTPADFTPLPGTRAGCRISASGVLSCACPPVGTWPDPNPSTTDPSFTVELADEPGDPQAIRLTAFGCINQTQACGSAGGQGDATATVSVVLKLRPLLRAVPATALTAGGATKVCGSLGVASSATTTHPYLINAGQGIQVGDAGSPTAYLVGAVPAGTCSGGTPALGIPPGTPVDVVLAPNDAGLAASAVQLDTWFRRLFGMPASEFQTAAGTFVVSGANLGDLTTAYANGFRRFWIGQDIDLGGATLGAPADPVVLVSTASVAITGNPILHGLFISNGADWNAPAAVNLRGAVVVRGDFLNNGGGQLTYDPAALEPLRNMGSFVRVPGSWRDFQ